MAKVCSGCRKRLSLLEYSYEENEKYYCKNCLFKLKTQEEKEVSDQLVEQEEYILQENIDFGTGLACGAIPFMGIIYSLISLTKHERRIAFQVFAIPVINFIVSGFLTIFIIGILKVSLGGYLILSLLIWLGLPLVITAVLRDLDWPTGASIVIVPKTKIPFSSLKNPLLAIDRIAYYSDNRNYLGKIVNIDLNSESCTIKTDFGEEISKSFSEIYIQDT